MRTWAGFWTFFLLGFSLLPSPAIVAALGLCETLNLSLAHRHTSTYLYASTVLKSFFFVLLTNQTKIGKNYMLHFVFHLHSEGPKLVFPFYRGENYGSRVLGESHCITTALLRAPNME